jgi:hypothetical protein
MRVLVVIPHFFGSVAADTTNKSRQQTARAERVQALTATITWLHYSFGTAAYGLDHEQRVAWKTPNPTAHALDVIVCTNGSAHLLGELGPLAPLFHHQPAAGNPVMLGFACHAILRDACGRYDYYCYLEDDIVITDPMFLRKRASFDAQFGPSALLQPQR